LTEDKKTSKWRWGVNRWIVLLLIILGLFGARAYSPIQPHVQLPAEELTGRISLGPLGEVALTNTIVAMILVDIIVILIALVVRAAVKRSEKEGYIMARGISGVIEIMFEALYNMTETTAGKWAKQIFPFFASITLVVLGVTAIVKEEVEHGGYGVIPFVRALSTDLNFTVALALVSVVMTQVIGIRAHGMNYFTKFWNTKTFFSKPIFGLIDWAVGLLEVVSEFSKILSFSFRLFGNIFAGSVMLFVIGSLVPIIAQAGFLALEFFVGAVQAVVFGMLTMIFMAMAVQGHGHEEEH